MEYMAVKDLSDFLSLPYDSPRSLEGDCNGTRVNMGSKVKYFYSGAVIRISDDNSPLGENGTVSSVNGTAVILTSAVGTNYQVSQNAEMQNECYFTPMTRPKYSDIENLIETNEDILDMELRTSFRENGTLTSEYLTPGLRDQYSFPYLSQPLRYGFDVSNPVFTRHSPILPFDPTKGDKVYVMIGHNNFVNILEKSSGYLIWDSYRDVLVSEQNVTGTSNFTNLSPRLNSFIRYEATLTGSSGTITVNGTDIDGVHRSESVALSNGLNADDTTYAYREVGTVTINGTAEVQIDTMPVTSRQNDSFDFWTDYQHGIIWSKEEIIHSVMSVKIDYRKSRYARLRGVPGYVKRMCTYLCAIDILENERYALNMPGGEGENAYLKIASAVSNWKKRYRELLYKNREYVGGAIYE